MITRWWRFRHIRPVYRSRFQLGMQSVPRFAAWAGDTPSRQDGVGAQSGRDEALSPNIGSWLTLQGRENTLLRARRLAGCQILQIRRVNGFCFQAVGHCT